MSARDPTDYIWPHICMKKRQRLFYTCLGWGLSFGIVALFTWLAITLQVLAVELS